MLIRLLLRLYYYYYIISLCLILGEGPARERERNIYSQIKKDILQEEEGVCVWFVLIFLFKKTKKHRGISIDFFVVLDLELLIYI